MVYKYNTYNLFKKLIKYAELFRMLEQEEISVRIEKLVYNPDNFDVIEQKILIDKINIFASVFDGKEIKKKKFDLIIKDLKDFFSKSEKKKEKFKREEKFKRKVKKFIDLLHIRSFVKEKEKFEQVVYQYYKTVNKEEKKTLKVKINAFIFNYHLALKIQKEIEDDQLQIINTELYINYIKKKLVIRQDILAQDDSYNLLKTYLKEYTTYKGKKHFSPERKKELITLLKEKTSELFLLKNNKLPKNVDRLFEDFLLEIKNEIKQLEFLIEEPMRKLDKLKLNLVSNLTIAKEDFLINYFIDTGANLIKKSEKLLLDSETSIAKSKRIYRVLGQGKSVFPETYKNIREIYAKNNNNILPSLPSLLPFSGDDQDLYLLGSSLVIAQNIPNAIPIELISSQNENSIFIIVNSPIKETNKVNIISKFPVTEFNKNYYYVLTLNKKVLLNKKKNFLQYDINVKNKVKLMSANTVEMPADKAKDISDFVHKREIVIEKTIKSELNTYDILLRNVDFEFEIIHQYSKIVIRNYEVCNTKNFYNGYQLISIFDPTVIGKIKCYLFDKKNQVFTGRVILLENDFFLHLIFRKKVNFNDMVATDICKVSNIKIININANFKF